MTQYSDDGHPGLDEAAKAERPWTRRRSSVYDGRDQIENVEEQWIVVDGPGERALRLRQTEAIRDVLRWLTASRADKHNQRNDGGQPD